MNWIDDIVPEYGTVTGQYVAISYDSNDPDLTPDVQPLNGSITLTPTVEAGRIDSALAQIFAVQVRVFGGQIVDDEDQSGVRILSNDTSLGVVDWAWTARFEFDSGLKLKPLTFKIRTGETVNLTSGIVPVESAPYQIVQGEPGQSAFEMAVRNGYQGTETQWLASLKGEKGDGSAWSDLIGKPTTFPPAPHQHRQTDIPVFVVTSPVTDYTLLEPGTHSFRNTAVARDSGLPDPGNGFLEVVADQYQRILEWSPTVGTQTVWRNSRAGSAEWTGWSVITPDAAEIDVTVAYDAYVAAMA